MRRPSLPAELDGSAASRLPRFPGGVTVDDRLVRQLSTVCTTVETSDESRVRAGRDWWPLSVHWATEGRNAALPAVVVQPASTQEVSAVMEICNRSRIPVVPFAGRSGVCGGSLPVFGGVSMDLTGVAGLLAVDDTSLTVEVAAGTFGDDLEAEVRRAHGLTVGHWPQSIALSTVGGWVACRSAGQYSTRYGKIEDIVAGLEVVLADGRVVRTGHFAPRAATGPDLTQVFVGSEGTLGVVTKARLRARPQPEHEVRSAWAFSRFADGLEACRRILRRGATPAVLRLYDPTESGRHFDLDDVAVLIVLDEGDAALVEATTSVAARECESAGASQLDLQIAARWLEHRNDLPPLESLARSGIVADTVEIAGSWAALPLIYTEAVDALMKLDGTLVASAHQSHAYTDGACLYFTFAGQPAGGTLESKERYYRSALDTVTAATANHSGAISHHHGIGVNRGMYLRDDLGAGFDVLAQIKQTLDPNGILNPGKLGLPSPFGDPPVVPA